MDVGDGKGIFTGGRDTVGGDGDGEGIGIGGRARERDGREGVARTGEEEEEEKKKRRVRKVIFTEVDCIRDKDFTSGTEAFITFMRWTIAKKDTFGGPILYFMLIIRFDIRKTCTTKGLENGIVWSSMKKGLEWGRIAKTWSRKAVDEKSSSGKGIPSEMKGKRGLSKKRETGFYDVLMFSFSLAILRVNIGTWVPKVNAQSLKIRNKRPIFPTPIGLKTTNLSIKLSIDHGDERLNNLTCFRF